MRQLLAILPILLIGLVGCESSTHSKMLGFEQAKHTKRTKKSAVRAVAVIDHISVTPIGVGLYSGVSKTFTATAVDVSGAAVAVQPTISWYFNGGTLNGVNATPLQPVTGTSVVLTAGNTFGEFAVCAFNAQ